MAFRDASHIDASGSIINTADNIHNYIGQGPRTDSPGVTLDLYNLLAPVDAAYNRGGPVDKCLGGTREGLIAKINQWKDGDPAHPICWLYGPDGSGKSAVAQTVGDYCHSNNQMAASFFFLRGVQNRSISTHLVLTLAYELSISVPATKPLIQRALKTDRSIPQRSLKYQFEKLMVEPILAVLNEAALTPEATVIIIDALDECFDKRPIVELIQAIANIANACLKIRPFPFRIFLTSTIEIHLRVTSGVFAAPSIIYPLNLQNFDAGDDIHKFFRSQFSIIYEEKHEVMHDISRPWPSNSDVESLVEKAGGSFRRASEFISFINDGTDAPDRQLAAIFGRKPDRRRRQSSKLSKIIKWPLTRTASQQASENGSPNDVSPPSTSSILLDLSEATAGGSQDSLREAGSARAHQPRILTTDIQPSPPVLCESPVEDGSVETTTLESLIDNLILPSYGKPEGYRNVFFTTYTAFTTTDEVFRSLVHRFSEAGANLTQRNVQLRINIINLMKYWVTMPHFEVDTNVLARMAEFASSIRGPKTMERLAKELYSAGAAHSTSPSQPHTAISQKPVRPETPPDLAIALLMLEGYKYSRIRPANYISYFQQRSGENNLRLALETNHAIASWVQQTILRYDDFRERRCILEFFVSTAEESRKLCNFASMSAIMTALRSTTITRLKLTYETLPKDLKSRMKKTETFLNPHGNPSAYEATLKGSNNLPCVPVLDAHLADIRTAFSEAMEAVDVDGILIVNFAKWTEFYIHLNKVHRHKAPDVSKYRLSKAGMLAYLERKLHGIFVGPATDLEKRSNKLQDEENQMSKLKIDRFNEVSVG